VAADRDWRGQGALDQGAWSSLPLFGRCLTWRLSSVNAAVNW
jgi:hypothetical protein